MLDTQKLNRMISEHFGIPLEDVAPEANFYKDFNATNLEMADLVPKLEKEFNLNVKDGELNDIKTVGELTSFMEDNIDEF